MAYMSRISKYAQPLVGDKEFYIRLFLNAVFLEHVF